LAKRRPPDQLAPHQIVDFGERRRSRGLAALDADQGVARIFLDRGDLRGRIVRIDLEGGGQEGPELGRDRRRLAAGQPALGGDRRRGDDGQMRAIGHVLEALALLDLLLELGGEGVDRGGALAALQLPDDVRADRREGLPAGGALDPDDEPAELRTDRSDYRALLRAEGL